MIFFFRRNRAAGWVAMFAIVLQLVLSFGHRHADGHWHGIGQLTAEACPVLQSTACGPSDNHHSDAACDVCWVAGIAASATAPEQPFLVIRGAVIGAARGSSDLLVISDAGAMAFQARAPPVWVLG